MTRRSTKNENSAKVNKTTTRRAEAACYDCDKSWSAVNALATASRHAAAFGHTVAATQVIETIYAPKVIE